MNRPIPLPIPLLLVVASLLLLIPASANAQDGPEPTAPDSQDGVIYLPLISGAAGTPDGDQPPEEGSGPPIFPWEISPTDEFDGILPVILSDNLLANPVVIPDALSTFGIDPALLSQSGRRRVVIRLSQPSGAEVAAAALEDGSRDAYRVQAQTDRINAQQERLITTARDLDRDVEVLARTEIALNSVIMNIDADALAELAADPSVLSIRPVIDYEIGLSEVVPWIGAGSVQSSGYDGSGIRVAVLDSGVDYTHVDLGGSGELTDYTTNDPTIITDIAFPTAKVVGGFDFVGSDWPGTEAIPAARSEDPDPLDDGIAAGHGTHVADMIAGVNGVAPGADLFAVKVCSSISPACNGVSLLKAMDFVLDPDGDLDLSDRVDIINFSLGSNYGQALI